MDWCVPQMPKTQTTPPEHQRYNVHPSAVAPGNRICIDIVGPLEESKQGNTHILTIYDPFSHWPCAYAIKKQDAETVIACLQNSMSTYSPPAELLSDRGKNFMSKAVADFLECMGTKKYSTTPYKPSSNGSVERFHKYLADALQMAVKQSPNTWEDHLDTVLYAYRSSPIDGLDITPFEVMFGRKPNLPIDNLLFRENYSESIETLPQYMEYMLANQESMYRAVKGERQERFNRNKKAAGQHKKNKNFEVGDKVYLSFPKGRFRISGGSTKLAPRNDGPYTVIEKLQDGLVYKVQHDAKGFIHNASVSKMIGVAGMVIPKSAVDIPLSDRWQQLTDRTDRINDLTEGQENRQKSEANNEERKSEVKEEPEEKFSLEDDNKCESEDEGETEQQHKRKATHNKAT